MAKQPNILVGIRYFRDHLSKYLELTRYHGRRFIVGSRGRPWAALVPLSDLEALGDPIVKNIAQNADGAVSDYGDDNA